MSDEHAPSTPDTPETTSTNDVPAPDASGTTPDPAPSTPDTSWPFDRDFKKRQEQIREKILEEPEQVVRDRITGILGGGRLATAVQSAIPFPLDSPFGRAYQSVASWVLAVVLTSAIVFEITGHLLLFGAFGATYWLSVQIPGWFFFWMVLYCSTLVLLLGSLTKHVVVPPARRTFPRAVTVPSLLLAAWVGPTLIFMTLVNRGWQFTAGEDGPLLTDKSDLWAAPAWHMVDVLPFVKVTETLAWDNPFDYEQLFVGFVILAATLALVLGVAEVVKNTWKELTK